MKFLPASLTYVLLICATAAAAQFKTPLPKAENPQAYDVSSLSQAVQQAIQHTPDAIPASERSVLAQVNKLPFVKPVGLVEQGRLSAEAVQEWPVQALNINTKLQAQAFRSQDAQAITRQVLQTAQLPLNNAREELSLIEDRTDRFGIRHLKLQQEVDGVPVFGAYAFIHLPSEGEITLNGRLEPSVKNFSTQASLDKPTIESLLEAEYGQRASYPVGSAAHLAHPDDSPLQLVIFHKDGKPYLAYAKTIHPDLAHRYRVILDAHTGEELAKYDEICKLSHHPVPNKKSESLPPETGQGIDLNGVSRGFGVYSNGGTFWMVDGSKPMFNQGSSVPQNMDGAIVTADAQGTYPDNAFNAVYSEDNTNNWNVRSEVSAHYNSDFSYEYFRTKFGRNSIDGNGGSIIAFIDVADENGAAMDNAFWNGRAMFYGTGNQAFTDLAGSLDVGGHEMSHGVIQNTANLIYENESGALNEHFADVFGVMIDRDDWRLGEDIVTNAFPSGALRDCADPRQGGSNLNDPGYQPGHYSERYTGSQDNGGVHINSGIVNNVCYRIAQAIGRDKTEQLYYNVLANYLSANAQFIDYRNALQQASGQMYGQNSTEQQAVVAALDAQGIPGSSSGGGGTTQPSGQQTNPGTQLVAYANANEQLVRVSDLSANVIISDITPSYIPISKPSITDNGALAVLVTDGGDLNLIEINYSNNTVNENFIDGDLNNDGQGDVRNAALSRDGSKLAFITSDNSPFIYVLDIVNDRSEAFELYTPGSNGERVYTVDYADVMEWDYTGEYILFDALNTLTGTNGLEVSSWDIGFIEVYQNGVGFTNGEVRKLFSTLEPGASVGNPTLAKNSEQIMAFDYFEGNTYQTLAVNLLTGEQGVLWNGDRLGWPTYTADDAFVIFNAVNNNEAVLGAVEVTSNKLANADPNGGGLLYANDGYRAWAYANGNRVIVSSIADILAGADWTVGPNPSTGNVSIFRRSDASPAAEDFILYDGLGRQVKRFASNVLKLDLAGLPAGTYFLKQGQTSRQLVVR